MDFNGRRDIWLCPVISWVQGWDGCWDYWLICSGLASQDALLEFGLLVRSVMDLMVLILFCGFSWGLFSEKRQCWMVFLFLLQYQHEAASFSGCVWKIQIQHNSIHYFQRSIDWGFQWMMRCQFTCSVILWVRGWGCCWGWWKFCSSMGFRDTLLVPVGLAGLGMDQMVLFFFCDFFWGLVMLKRPETIVFWQHWFGRSLLPRKPSNSPRWCEGRHDGAEGAISTKQYTGLHWAVNEAHCLSDYMENWFRKSWFWSIAPIAVMVFQASYIMTLTSIMMEVMPGWTWIGCDQM